jgi:4-amino-4-deoxy-L-arabinose transferase-like glycosyltransferase
VLVQLRTPEFFRVFFLQHNLARFGSNLYRHKQPFWYYIPVALIATIPWSVWLMHGLADAISALRRTPAPAALTNLSDTPCDTPEPATLPEEAEAPPSFTFEVFLFLWAILPIAFFSLSRSKLPGYILPAIPPLLILTAVAIHRRAALGQPPRWFSITAHGVLLAGLGAAGCIAPRIYFKLPVSASARMIAAVVGTAIFLLVALPLLTAGWRMLHFVTLLPIILVVGFILRGVAPAIDATQSARPVAQLLQQMDQPGPLPLATFALSRNTAFALAFYLDRRVAPYEGLEISPAVYELPAAIPASAHILIAREGSIPSLRLLLSGRSLRLLGSYRPQRVEIFFVSPAP